MLVNTEADEGFTRELTPVTSATLFSGFVPYQREQVGEFFAASERAFSDQAA